MERAYRSDDTRARLRSTAASSPRNSCNRQPSLLKNQSHPCFATSCVCVCVCACVRQHAEVHASKDLCRPLGYMRRGVRNTYQQSLSKTPKKQNSVFLTKQSQNYTLLKTAMNRWDVHSYAAPSRKPHPPSDGVTKHRFFS